MKDLCKSIQDDMKNEEINGGDMSDSNSSEEGEMLNGAEEANVLEGILSAMQGFPKSHMLKLPDKVSAKQHDKSMQKSGIQGSHGKVTPAERTTPSNADRKSKDVAATHTKMLKPEEARSKQARTTTKPTYKSAHKRQNYPYDNRTDPKAKQQAIQNA